jgi:hypothetical protein
VAKHLRRVHGDLGKRGETWRSICEQKIKKYIFIGEYGEALGGMGKPI